MEQSESQSVAELPKAVEYICKEKSLIGNEIKEAGEKCLYAGLPAENLIPTCDIGRARYQEYLESNKARIAKMIQENSVSTVGDQDSFMKNLAKMNQEMAAQQSAQICEAAASAVVAAMAQFFPNGVPALEAPADKAPTKRSNA